MYSVILNHLEMKKINLLFGKNNTGIVFYNKKMTRLLFVLWIGIFSKCYSQSNITIGTGANHSSSSYPFSRYFKYSGCELLYTGTEIGTTGDITALAFDKYSGTSGIAINNISVYMKTTNSSVLSSPTCTTGYVLVYSGTFPNNGTSGWQTQVLTTPFTYSTTSENLSILIIHGSQTAVSTTDRPVYNSSSTSVDLCSYYVDDSNGWSCSKAMNMPGERPNIQLTFSSVTTNIPNHEKDQFLIYPNPASRVLKLNMKDAIGSVQKIIILDGQGKICVETSFIQDALQNGICLDGMSKGIYKVLVVSENMHLSKTFTIE